LIEWSGARWYCPFVLGIGKYISTANSAVLSRESGARAMQSNSLPRIVSLFRLHPSNCKFSARYPLAVFSNIVPHICVTRRGTDVLFSVPMFCIGGIFLSQSPRMGRRSISDRIWSNPCGFLSLRFSNLTCISLCFDIEKKVVGYLRFRYMRRFSDRLFPVSVEVARQKYYIKYVEITAVIKVCIWRRMIRIYTGEYPKWSH